MNIRRVTWDSASSLLEKISVYEAVHPLRGWTDLKVSLNKKIKINKMNLHFSSNFRIDWVHTGVFSCTHILVCLKSRW